MKLNFSVLSLAVLQATTGVVMAGDTLKIVNINDNGWSAMAAWDRGNGDIRPIHASDGCIHAPYTPWADIQTFCINWWDDGGRGHIWTTAGHRHCFKKRVEDTINPGASMLSIWDTADCTWSS